MQSSGKDYRCDQDGIADNSNNDDDDKDGAN